MILPDIELLARERQAELRRAAEEARQSRLARDGQHGSNHPRRYLPLPPFRRS